MPVVLGLSLSTSDALVLAGYTLLLLAAGWFLSRRRAKDTAGYFLAARSMPAWAVAFSILATAQSAATYLGAPEKGFNQDLSYLLANLGVMVAAIVVSLVFLPVYYTLNVQTPYQLLETAFGPQARRMASVWYLLGRFMASGARLYIGAVPFCIVLFGEEQPLAITACILGFMLFGALFTLAGGVRAAIWSDVLQVAVYIGAAICCIVVLLNKLPPDGLQQALTNITITGPLADNWSFTKNFTILNSLTGYALLNIAFIAMDQDLTQRLLTCRSAAEASKSLVINTVLITLPVVGLFLFLGLLLKGFYGSKPASSTDLLLQFSADHGFPGLMGLMLAGVLAAGPAGINGSLNSMASSFIADIYTPLRPGRSDAHYLKAGRLATFFAGIIMAAFACLCISWKQASGKNIIDFVLGVMPFAYTGLLGVFFCAVIFKRGSQFLAILALFVGLGVTVALQWTSLALPWQLVIGTAAAFITCMPGCFKRRT